MRHVTLLHCCVCLAIGACGSDGAPSVEQPIEDGHSHAAGAHAHAAGTGATAEVRGGDGATAAPPATQAGAAAPADTGHPSDHAGAQAQTPAPNTNPGAQAAGAPATPASNAGQGATTPPNVIDHHADIRGLCDLKTKFPDDHACIPAPPASEGMQIRIGPSAYDDADEVAKFIMRPGEESSECFTAVTPNDKPIYYQTALLSGRAGTHHIINTLYKGNGANAAPERCTQGQDSMQSLGSFPGASKAYMPRLSVAPEYAHIGRVIPPHSQIQSDMHYYNFTDKDILREYWVNVYFVPAEQITEESKQIAGLGGFGWNQNPIQPKTDKVFTYSCPIKGEGYILSLLGHYHAHGKRFTATITRKAGGTEKVFEMYDYMEPAQFEYNSIITNPMFSESAAGAITGRLAVHDGDTLNWECRIVNDSDSPLRYTNEVKTGEMCNLWGQSVGVAAINCYLP